MCQKLKTHGDEDDPSTRSTLTLESHRLHVTRVQRTRQARPTQQRRPRYVTDRETETQRGRELPVSGVKPGLRTQVS